MNFNSKNPNVIKRDLSELQGWWRLLKLQSEKERDLHSRETKKKGGGKALASPGSRTKQITSGRNPSLS